jgi:hypothetical protein
MKILMYRRSQQQNCGKENSDNERHFAEGLSISPIQDVTLDSRHLDFVQVSHSKQNKLRGLQSERELYRLGDRHLLAKFSANF